MYNGFAWLDMRQARAIWLIIKVREAGIRLNKANKMRLLHKVMAILDKGLPHRKGKMSAWVANAK